MSSKEEGEDENAIVVFDAESGYYTSVELAKMPANGKDAKLHGQTGIREMRVDHTQIGSSEMQVEGTRPQLLGVQSEGGKVDIGRTGMERGDNSRRTSSSSLADILNPVKEPPVIQANHSPKDMFSTTTIRQTLPEPQPQSLTSQVYSVQVTATIATGNNTEDDGEMIDVVGVNGETEGTDTTAMQDVIANSVSIQSRSTDFQQPIHENVTNLPLTDTKSALPSRTPSPSRKRKYTPESSPDEPLSLEIQQQPLPSHLETEIQSQISVEKPKGGSRVIKTSRAPIKHPHPRASKVSKKKPKVNGERKKPGLKPNEKSASVGVDDVSLSRIIRLTIGHTNTTIQRYPVHCIILIL